MTAQNFDVVDVLSALGRDTKDGPGTDDLSSLPPSNFVAFATDDVEKKEDDK
jgi:hypothetical protein